jgi:hypothetical protein
MLQRRRRPARPAGAGARPTLTHRAPTVRSLSNFVWPPWLRASAMMVSRALRNLAGPIGSALARSGHECRCTRSPGPGMVVVQANL